MAGRVHLHPPIADRSQAYFGNHYILDNVSPQFLDDQLRSEPVLTTLKLQYCAVQDAFSLSVQEWQGIATASIRGSWCTNERKTQLLERLGDVIRTHGA